MSSSIIRGRNFEEEVSGVDVVFDTVGGDTQQRAFQTLKRGGVLVSSVSPPVTGQGEGVRRDGSDGDDDAKARSTRGDQSPGRERKIKGARGNGVTTRGSEESASTLGLRTRGWENYFASLTV